jgi:hypothetical protein
MRLRACMVVAYIIDAMEHPEGACYAAKARHSLPILVGDRLLWLLALVVTNTTLTPTHAASRRKPVPVDDGRHGFLGGDRAVRTVTSAAMHEHASILMPSISGSQMQCNADPSVSRSIDGACTYSCMPH